jgi:hypothetical protein
MHHTGRKRHNLNTDIVHRSKKQMGKQHPTCFFYLERLVFSGLPVCTTNRTLPRCSRITYLHIPLGPLDCHVHEGPTKDRSLCRPQVWNKRILCIMQYVRFIPPYMSEYYIAGQRSTLGVHSNKGPRFSSFNQPSPVILDIEPWDSWRRSPRYDIANGAYTKWRTTNLHNGTSRWVMAYGRCLWYWARMLRLLQDFSRNCSPWRLWRFLSTS